jgi:hypothetical protein
MPAERAKSWDEAYPILGKIDSFFGLGGASTATHPAAAAAGGGSGAFGSDYTAKEAYIRQVAAQIGINPDDAVRVAKSEGFNAFTGDNGTSFGAFQLHVTPNGRGHAVGDQFRADTGLDPSNPANERASIDYALNWARKHGWGDFHGAARVGMGQWQGIGGGSQTDVSIGSITINTRATDANGIARDLGGELKNRLSGPSSLATQANTGMTP